jgi:hypothetical protein
LTPTLDPEGHTISGLYWGGSGAILFLNINLATNPGSIYVYSLAIGATTLLGSAANYSYVSGVGTWSWGYAGFTDGDTYTAVLTL